MYKIKNKSNEIKSQSSTYYLNLVRVFELKKRLLPSLVKKINKTSSQPGTYINIHEIKKRKLTEVWCYF